MAEPHEPAVGTVLLSEDQIHRRLTELAAEIDADYAGRELVLLGVPKGAMMILADLSRRLRPDRVVIDWVEVSSYGDATTSSGVGRTRSSAPRRVAREHLPRKRIHLRGSRAQPSRHHRRPGLQEPHGPALIFAPADWAAFTAGIRSGKFDIH